GRGAVERGDPLEQLGFGEIGRIRFVDRADSRLGARLDLVAYVDLACRVVADEDDGEAGNFAGRRETCGAARDLGADFARDRGAVDPRRGRQALLCAPSAILSRSATVFAFSFSMMLARCASTVLMLMPRSSAICLLSRPATIRSSTCASRVVR